MNIITAVYKKTMLWMKFQTTAMEYIKTLESKLNLQIKLSGTKLRKLDQSKTYYLKVKGGPKEVSAIKQAIEDAQFLVPWSLPKILIGNQEIEEIKKK